MDTRVQHGFTLTELMIALALSSVVAVSMYSTFVQQQRTATQQEQITEARQTVRLTIDAMLTELRTAGFDPDGSAKARIMAADSTSIRFTRDMNCNGTIAQTAAALPAQGVRDSNDEDVAYRFMFDPNDPAKQELQRAVYENGVLAGGFQPVASNMLNIDFCYFVLPNLTACVPNPAVMGDIRAVQIIMTGRAAAADPQYTDRDPQSNPAFKHHHKATLTSLVQFRNLGANRGGPNAPQVHFNDPCPLR